MPAASLDDIDLVISPCPNDTFIFHAWLHGLVAPPPRRVRLLDVEACNGLAAAGEPDVAKISAACLAEAAHRYTVLDAGAALGFGCGPVAAVRPGADLERAAVVAIPGARTTAALLMARWLEARGLPEPRWLVLPYDQVLDAVLGNEAQAGVCIHESRFLLAEKGLEARLDLGQWWEEATGAPLPLGVIVGRADLGQAMLERISRTIRASLEHAWARPEDGDAFIAGHAREMDPVIVARHIQTFVTPFSASMGKTGRDALRRLLQGSRGPELPMRFAGGGE